MMNTPTATLKKREIYNKLAEFTDQELTTIITFIDFIRYQHTGRAETRKIMKLEGILKDYTIDVSDLKNLRKQIWEHVDEECLNG